MEPPIRNPGTRQVPSREESLSLAADGKARGAIAGRAFFGLKLRISTAVVDTLNRHTKKLDNVVRTSKLWHKSESGVGNREDENEW